MAWQPPAGYKPVTGYPGWWQDPQTGIYYSPDGVQYPGGPPGVAGTTSAGATTTPQATNPVYAPPPAPPAPPPAPSSTNGLGGLAGGLSAGIGADQPSNPPFDPRIYGGNKHNNVMRVGYMMAALQYAGQPPLPGTGLYSLRFLYNPSQITNSFTFNPSVLNPMFQSGGTPGASVKLLATGQFVSFDLLFDRSYELMVLPDEITQGRGALVDVAAFENLLGMLQSDNLGAVPESVPMQVVFGKTDTGYTWGTTGYITQADVTYLTFTRNMIPQRAAINVTLQQTFVPQSVSPGTGDPPHSGHTTQS